jgi:hypothetical protein
MTVAEMMSELSDHGFDDASDARMLAVLNDANRDACSRRPWPFLEKTILLTFDGSSGVPTNSPSDLRAVTSVGIVAGGDTCSTQPQWMRRDVWLSAYASAMTTTGTPTVFTFLKGAPSFYPIPPASMTIQMDYVCRPAALADNTAEADIEMPPDFHRNVIVNGALYKLYAMEDDTDIAPTFETYYENALQTMVEFCETQQYQRSDVVYPVDLEDLGVDQAFYGGWWATS